MSIILEILSKCKKEVICTLKDKVNNYSMEVNRDYMRSVTSHSNFIFDLTTTDYIVPQNSVTHFLYNRWSPPERGLE